MAFDRKAMFAAAQKKRAAEKEEESNRSSWSGEYENTYWMSLQTDAIRVFRIVGCPLSDRHDAFDPKKINVARIKADNGSWFYCIFPDKQTQSDWILWRIWDLVTKGTMTGSGKSRHKIYDYEKSHPECFRRVIYNDTENNPFEKGWFPQTRVVMNVIDRHDPEFHKNTKHTKILSSKANESKNKPGTFFYDWGVPLACYNTIWDNVVEYSGDWADYDIGVMKLNDTPFYNAFHGVDDSKKLKDAAKFVVDGPMTPEEEAYEKYDLDEMFRITSYTKIKAKLGNFIRKVDIDFNTHFADELEKLVSEEQSRWKAEGRNNNGYLNTQKSTSQTSPAKQEEFVENDYYEDPIPAYQEEEYSDTKAVIEPVRVRQVSIDWDSLADGSFNGTKYLGVPGMTDEEKACVVSVNKETGAFVYKEGLEILMNTKNHFESPTIFHIDPLSGEIFPDM